MSELIEFVRRVFDFLRGKRTYIIGFLIFCVGGAHALGWLDTKAYEALLGFLLSGGLVSLRAAIKASYV